jgi:hypothetical protein
VVLIPATSKAPRCAYRTMQGAPAFPRQVSFEKLRRPAHRRSLRH